MISINSNLSSPLSNFNVGFNEQVSGGGVNEEDVVKVDLLYYKTYGNNSYVYQDKERWLNICKSEIGINDPTVGHECLEYVFKNHNKHGYHISLLYGLTEETSTAVKAVDDIFDILENETLVTSLKTNTIFAKWFTTYAANYTTSEGE